MGAVQGGKKFETKHAEGHLFALYAGRFIDWMSII